MGLDNGIEIKNFKKDKLNEIPNFIQYTKYCREDTDVADVEIAYWRKCWGIRAAILDVLNSNEEYGIKIDREDIPKIIEVLIPFFSKEYWTKEANSIWEFEEYFNNMLSIMINLKWLYSYMEDNPNLEVVFYDSY